MLKLEKLENDEQLDIAIAFADEYIKTGDLDDPDLTKLSELIHEYEERTDVLNR